MLSEHYQALSKYKLEERIGVKSNSLFHIFYGSYIVLGISITIMYSG